MLRESLIEIFNRDLDKLKDEINLYEDENNLWTVKAEINNSAGNLCLHLIGNLNHFIGTLLGQTGYARERDREFSSMGIAREDLLAKIEKTKEVVAGSLQKLSDADF